MLGTARARRESTALPDNIYGYQEAQTNGDLFYIAAKFERRKLPAEFVLGNGKTYGGYENVPLKPGTRYKVYVRGVTERDGKWLYGEPAALSLPKTDETPVVKEGDNMVGVIAGVPGALILIVITIVAFHLYQRSNRPPNANLKVESQKEELRLRRFSAKVTAVEGDETQENLTLVPVGVSTQLAVSECKEHRSPEFKESIVVYEEIGLFSPGLMVRSCSGQTPEVSRACSHIYTPLEKREEEEHEYVNQIKPPEYMNTYMPLIKGDNPKLLADNAPDDQTQENLTLVPVGVTTLLTVSESNERCSLETKESIVVYEEIDLFLPGMMVLNGSGQIPEVSSACSHIYTPLEKREEEEYEYANQIKPPEYMTTYMPLIKGGNLKMLADNSDYASVL